MNGCVKVLYMCVRVYVYVQLKCVREREKREKRREEKEKRREREEKEQPLDGARIYLQHEAHVFRVVCIPLHVSTSATFLTP
jgi:hypothetical protein